jgi:hypothetical protein
MTGVDGEPRDAGEPEYRLLPVEIDSQTLMIKSQDPP